MTLKKLKRLGGGGFGIVDLVVDEDGVEYARKTFQVNQPLPPDLILNVKKRFAREARTQKGIEHKNIVPVISEDFAASPPFYLMPVAICSLSDDIAADRTLGGEYLSVFTDIVAALDEMHELSIYHRDLKPQNVLKFDGKDGKIFYAVSDFGLIALNETRLSALTTTGMAKGTDYYTAPEITTDLRSATAQSDVYSLGCILHDIVGQKARVPCAEIREDGDYGAILLNCTRQNPTRRFKSVRAVLDAILSVETSGLAVESDAASGFMEDLKSKNPLSEEKWGSLISYIEDHSQSKDAVVLLLNVDEENILNLCGTYPQLAARFGTTFARWVHDAGLNFDTCDTIANRLEIFIQKSTLDVQADCLMAMLHMGTSHNRWYVERKFMNLCGPELDLKIAKRLSVDLRAADEVACMDISHVERSISARRESLHPLLVKTLEQICS